MKNETSFDNLLYDYQFNNGPGLTEKQIDAIVKEVGYRCQQRTKDRLYRRLNCLGVVRRVGIFSRLMITKDNCYYVVGQSYTDEMRTVRECILD